VLYGQQVEQCPSCGQNLAAVELRPRRRHWKLVEDDPRSAELVVTCLQVEGLRAFEPGANGYIDKLSDGVRWDEMVRTVA
jgi:hypothetical protein